MTVSQQECCSKNAAGTAKEVCQHCERSVPALREECASTAGVCEHCKRSVLAPEPLRRTAIISGRILRPVRRIEMLVMRLVLNSPPQDELVVALPNVNVVQKSTLS